MKHARWIAAWLCLVSADAIACSCPPDTQDWWENSDNVALVRINATGVAALEPISDRACVKGQLCVLKQTAAYTVVEIYKGERLSVPRLTSGYSAGDCGIPLIAGAYYVVFQHQQSASVGFCNAAGPYPPRYPYKDRYPRNIMPFLESLRRASKDPNAKLGARPQAMF